jgi:hypothetical protein
MNSTKASGNPYEVFRDTIVATVYATVVKVRDTSTSFNWSLGKVISACAEACKLPLQDTPEEFKRIVKFEFDKLRDFTARNDSFELVRSRKDFVLNDGQMKARIVNTSLAIVKLEIQLQEARDVFSRLGFKLTDASLSVDKRSAIRKKLQKYIVVIDHVSAEIERQSRLQVEASKLQLEAEQSASDKEATEKFNLELAKNESS